jgi:ubiquinone/menaquinone biosynthesis C-methylase UbiE
MTPNPIQIKSPVRLVLNVGGGASRDVPKKYDGWTMHVLDIDRSCNPDICLDAMELDTLDPNSYDAIVCSHNLEHFYRHDVPKVLLGFLHVLKLHGYADIVVPSVNGAIRDMRERGLDLSDVWYRTSSGNPITFHDVFYGWNEAMSQGNLYYSHKCAFTPISLGNALLAAGFQSVNIWEDTMNLYATAFKQKQG